MDLAHQSRPTIWFALLWKDFQQVKSTFIAVLAGVFAVQLLLLFSASFVQNAEARMALYGGTITFACIAPILLALGCGGMLIGQERQSGTWAWSSSLPASWRLALGSKLVVATVGSLGTSVPLAIIPLALWMTGQFLPTAGSFAVIYVSSLTVVIFFEVVVFCFLATILMRETLTALVVAGIGLATVQILLGAWFADYVSPAIIRWGAPSDQAGLIAFAIFIGLALTIGCVLMVVTFRWRWGIGQQATFAFWRNTSSVRVPSSVRYEYAEGIAPSEWWMMFRHSVENSFWLRLIVVIGTFVLIANTSAVPNFVPGIAMLSVCILGVTAFEGDQTLLRFRFLADRGVVPWKLIASRLSVVAVWALLIIISTFVRFAGRSDQVAIGIVLGPIALAIGALSSMCFRKSVIAITAALVVSFAAFSVSVAIINLVQADAGSLSGQQPFTDFGWIVLYCTPIAVVALLAAIFRLSRRWLVLDNAKLEPYFVWISLTALLSPIVVACTFGFLMVPNVPWQGNPVLKLASERVLVPDLFHLNEPILTDMLPHMRILSLSRGRGMEGVADSANDAVGQILADLAMQRTTPEINLAAVIKPLLPPLEELIRGPRQQTGDMTRYNVSQLENLIARTAALATVAMRQGEPELALRIWRLNRELQEFAHQFDPLNTHASRNVAMHLLQQLRDRDVEAMGGPDVFRSLIPSVPDERTANMNEAREQAYNRRELLGRSNPVTMTLLPKTISGMRYISIQYFPPLRWLFERQIAVDLERHLNSTSPLSTNFLTSASRDSLVTRFPQ